LKNIFLFELFKQSHIQEDKTKQQKE